MDNEAAQADSTTHFTVLTLFPEMFDGFFGHSIIKKAIEEKKISAKAINIRDFAFGKHHVTDDKAYGGGSGMVMKPEALTAAISYAKEKFPDSYTVFLSPQGRTFNQKLAWEMSHLREFIFVCGRYEGVDERVSGLIDLELSIGDYVLTGGEAAAMVVIDAVARLIPDVLGGEDAAEKDSFSDGLLEHAHYTRPRIFNDMAVPEVLFSGHHKEIEKWRRESSLIRTFLKRPDLLLEKKLSKPDIEILKKWGKNIERIVSS